MPTRRVEQAPSTTFLLAAGVTFFMAIYFVAAYGTVAHAQNPSTTLTLPQAPEAPVSPTTPGTLPGTTAQDIAVGTNPITGAPCIGGGASAINGGIPGAPTGPDQLGAASQNAAGLPSSTSIYSLTNVLPNTTAPGAC